MEFKEVVKYLRKKNKITQKDLAKALNIGETTVSSWERGANYPTMDRVIMLADYFNVSISTFFENVPNLEETISLPVLGTIACGEPITAEENIEEYRETLKDNLPYCAPVNSGAFFIYPTLINVSLSIHQDTCRISEKKRNIKFTLI